MERSFEKNGKERNVLLKRTDAQPWYSAHSAFLNFLDLWKLISQFLGLYRRPIFKCFDIIKFVFPLAFQRLIPNCSTTKNREATAKTRHKVENDGKGGEVYDEIVWSSQYSFITHKNQVLVLTF